MHPLSFLPSSLRSFLVLPLLVHLLVVLVVLPTPTLSISPKTPKLVDVTRDVHINQPGPRFKWGGPCVADLDNDGRYDLLLSYHNEARLEVWFGNPNGTFTRHDLMHRIYDVHGVAVAPVSAKSPDRLIAVSVGGGKGAKPKPPFMYKVGPDRQFRDMTYEKGFGRQKGRGRTTVFMDMALRKNAVKRRYGGGPDMLFFSYRGTPGSKIRQFGYQNLGHRFRFRRVPGIEKVMRGRSEVTDNDGDGVMEVISIRELRMFKLVKAFQFKEVTRRLLPKLDIGDMTVSAVVEFDYDNDGDFDLYVARTNRTFITNRRPMDRTDDSLRDYLLENRNGRYYDVTHGAGIPHGTHSQGVTTGDLNNDGYLDLVVMQYRKKDLVLLNNGDGTFKQARGLIPKAKGTVGNHAVAFDYDLDGRVDVAVGHGERHGVRGRYRLMRNVSKRGGRRYLLVRVLHEPRRTTTGLHAVVSVKVSGVKGVMTRRVGSRGAQGGGGSFLDTVHFGLGRSRRVQWVRVKWTSGMQRMKWKVKSNRVITFGVL